MDEYCYSCGICGFPNSNKCGSIETKIGKMLIGGIRNIDSLKEHYLKQHPHDYKKLLQEIERLTNGQ